MGYSINNVATVWLAFSTTFQINVDIYASWNETVELSDPNGLLANMSSFTGTGTPAPVESLGAFTTPASYGDFPGYPVNVTITNSGGGATTSQFSYVNVLTDSNAVTSYDQLLNAGYDNLLITFKPIPTTN